MIHGPPGPHDRHRRRASPSGTTAWCTARSSRRSASSRTGRVVLDGATIGARRARRGGLGRRRGRDDPAGHAGGRLARGRAPAGEGQRRRDVGRDEPGRLRRARAAPPPRHRLRRPRGDAARPADVSASVESSLRGTGPTGLRRGWRRSRARRVRAGSGTPRRGSRPRSRCRARTARGRRPRSCAPSGPAATTSAQTRRRSTLAVAGMRIPARDLRSPASVDGRQEQPIGGHADRMFDLVVRVGRHASARLSTRRGSDPASGRGAWIASRR